MGRWDRNEDGRPRADPHRVRGGARGGGHLRSERRLRGVRGLIDSFEDDDRPITAVEGFEQELTSVERGIDPDQDTPAAQMTVAAAIWLSTNPDQEHHQQEHVLRESARLYFHGDPPADVAEWLREAGID